MKSLPVVSVCLALFFCGCDGPSSSDGIAKDVSTNSVEEVKGEAEDKNLVVAVGSSCLMEPEVERLMRLHIQIARLQGMKAALALDRFKAKLEQQAPYSFVNGRLLSLYAEGHGIRVTEQDRATRRAAIAKACGCRDFAALVEKIDPDLRGDLVGQTALDALKAKTKAAILSKVDSMVSDSEIKHQYSRLERINRNGAATNRLVYATASNVWQRIVSGKLTFDEAVADFTEDVSKVRDGYWGRFTAGELEAEPELLRMLSMAKVGTVLPPIECDNVLCVVKLLSRTREDEEPIYELARILFNIAEVFEVPGREELVKMIVEVRQNDAMEKALQPILLSNKVKYGPGWTRFGRKNPSKAKKRPNLNGGA